MQPKHEVTEHPLLRCTWVYRGVSFSEGDGIFAGKWVSGYVKMKVGEKNVEKRLIAPTRKNVLELIDLYREMYPE